MISFDGFFSCSDRPSRGRRLFLPSLSKRWPIGPYYDDLSKDRREHWRWSRYKLATAEWYLEALRQLAEKLPELDRYVGVEMALDGFLAGACSSVDAAVSALVVAIEGRLGVRDAEKTLPHDRSWKIAKSLAAKLPAGSSIASQASVDAALSGASGPSPTGALARLKRLRNTAIHQDTLGRAFYRSVGGKAVNQPCRLIVPGLGPIDALSYLEQALVDCRELADAILSDVDAIQP